MVTSVTRSIVKYTVDTWQGLNATLLHLEKRVTDDEYQALYYMLHDNDCYKYVSRCHECQRWFLSYRGNSQFCDDLCRIRHWRNLETEETIVKVCPVCHADILGHSNKRYCDRACRDKAYYQRRIRDRYK